jgi:hypothetical protein
MARRDLMRWLAAGLCGLLPACVGVPKDGAAALSDRAKPQAAAPAAESRPGAAADRTAVVASVIRPEPPRMPIDLDSVPLLPAATADARTAAATAEEAVVGVAASNPTAAEPALIAVLRSYLDKRPDEAMELLNHYDQPNQDLLLCLLPIVVRLTEGSLRQADPHEVEVMVEQLQGALAPLRPRAALKIDRLKFCWPTDTGIKLFDAHHPYRAGELVFLYIKPRNFTTVPLRPDGEPADGGIGAGYSVPLVSTLTVLTADGRPLDWKEVMPPAKPRPTPPTPHDFFQVLQFNLPKDLRPGAYQLVVELVDPPTKRVARSKLDFQVGS